MRSRPDSDPDPLDSTVEDAESLSIKKNDNKRSFVPIFLTLAFFIGALIIYQQFIYPSKNATMAMAAGQYELAGQYYTKNAQDGDIAAQNALGNLYYLGLGVPQDFTAAARWYFAAASKNYAAAQLNLANLFRQGLGVGSDPMRAFGWYRMSDINGNPRAEYYMAQLSLEFTLSPLQISTAKEKFAKLEALVAAGL